MSSHYFIKKYRQQRGSTEKTPLFVSRRHKVSEGNKDAFQVRYIGLCKTFTTVDASLAFTEKLLNNKLDDLVASDIILSVQCCDKTREIRLVTRGIDSDEPYFFTEKYHKETSLDFQVDTFTSSCCIMWKLHFMKFNLDYRLSLLRRNLIGYTHANRTQNNLSHRIYAQAANYDSVGRTSQLFGST